MDKVEIFKTEVGYIKDSRIKESINTLISLLPDYFFEVAASSTGKYHPEFSLNEGGLVRHTKAAVRIALELLNNKSVNNFSDIEKDLIIGSLILHDGIKHGKIKNQYTQVDHPLLASQFITENKDKTNLKEEEIKFMKSVIESHMGEWNKDFKGKEVLPLPLTKEQRFVHLCDFLSSRKFLDIKFLNNEIIE